MKRTDNKTTYLKTPVFKAVRGKFFEFRLLRRTTIDPEVWGKIRLFIILSRCHFMQQGFSHGIHGGTKCMLYLSFVPQAIPRCPYVDSRHKEQCNDSNRY